MDQPIDHNRSTRRRLLPLGGAIALATVAITGTAGAARPGPDPLLQCNPVGCAAAYIGVSPSQLSSAVEAESRRTGRPALIIVVDRLDAAEQHKLSTTTTTDDPMQALARHSIVDAHDALRDLLLTYAVGNVISPLAR